MTLEALHGVRIVDFSNWWVGSYAGMLMASAGAEVIKIESMHRLDPVRNVPGQRPGQEGPVVEAEGDTRHLELSYSFHMVNMNKLAITINLSDGRGVELAKRLIAISDATINNFSPGVMERLGLGYEVLKEVNPGIVMVSASSHGSTGPESKYVGYANVFNALGGLAHLTGYPDGTPTDLRGSIDLRGGTWAAFALILGLVAKQLTGRGQFIDVATNESIAALAGDSLMEYILNGRDRMRRGNGDDIMAPHNCYPCKGEDAWITIAVATDPEWGALRDAMGDPGWARAERFADAFSRWKHRDELDQYIGEWTRGCTPRELTALLQGKGVAAVPTFNALDVLSDPHLQERGTLATVEHPLAGSRKHVGAPWKLTGTPAAKHRHAPFVGQHNRYVFQELLGVAEQEMAHLVKERVIF